MNTRRTTSAHRLGDTGKPSIRGRGMSIDVLELINRLERLVETGARLPLTSKAMVDEQEFLDIIDQLRVAVPEEIKQARRVSQDKDRVIAQAQAEAEKIISSAQAQATLMLEENELVQSAHRQAASIVEEAEQKAEQLREESDAYALTVLTGLEDELSKLTATIRRGKITLERMRDAEAGARGDSMDGNPGDPGGGVGRP